MFEDRRIGFALLTPAAAFVGVAFLLPVLALLSESLRSDAGWSFARFEIFLSDPLNQEVFFRTLRIGLLVTTISATIGYATALAIFNMRRASRGRFTGLFILPLMVSPVARTYAWIVILGRTGIFNQLTVAFGISDAPLRILYSETAVVIGLVQLLLPLMILPLVSALENLPEDVVPAARVLGAGWLTVVSRVIIPLTGEGLVIGGTLVFAGAVTAYITPAVLGGAKVLMLETLLYQRVTVANDFLAASVIAVMLIAMSIAANVLLSFAGSRRERRA